SRACEGSNGARGSPLSGRRRPRPSQPMLRLDPLVDLFVLGPVVVPDLIHGRPTRRLHPAVPRCALPLAVLLHVLVDRGTALRAGALPAPTVRVVSTPCPVLDFSSHVTLPYCRRPCARWSRSLGLSQTRRSRSRRSPRPSHLWSY